MSCSSAALLSNSKVVVLANGNTVSLEINGNNVNNSILDKIIYNSLIINNSSVNISNETINDEIIENESNNSLETNTIIVYGYPSAWSNSRPYRLYKVTYLASILNIGSFNPKGVPENEFTKYSDSTDFDVVSGCEKDYHGFSIEDYIVNIEVA